MMTKEERSFIKDFIPPPPPQLDARSLARGIISPPPDRSIRPQLLILLPIQDVEYELNEAAAATGLWD